MINPRRYGPDETPTDVIERLAAEIERLRAENERLRKDLEIWRRNGGDDLQRIEIDRLQAENEELRELVSYLRDYPINARQALERKYERSDDR